MAATSEPDAMGQISARQISAEQISAEQISAEQISAEQVSAGQFPAGQLATGELPAGQVTAGALSAGEVPAGQIPAKPPAIRLRPLTVADLPQVSRWFAAPHVERWWHEASDLAAVRSHYLPCIDGSEPAHLLIAELPSGPFGLAQWYRWSDYPDHAHSLGANPDEAGFDYLIGSADLCGRGIGTRLIAMLVDHIRARAATVAGFVVDPEVANLASRRVLEKNGFELVTVKSIPDPDGHPIGPTAIYRRRLARR